MVKLDRERLAIIALYISKVSNSFVKFLIILIVTQKISSTVEFGKYSYFLTINNYLTLFIGFGFYAAVKRLISIMDEVNTQQEVCGSIYIINLILSSLFVIITFVVFKLIFRYTDSLILLCILSQSILLNKVVELLQIGSQRIKLMIVWETSINLSILILFLISPCSSYTSYLMLYFIVYLIVNNLIFFIGFKPKFTNILQNFRLILNQTKSYGWHVYIGSVTSMGTYDLDKIMVERFTGVEKVGYYNLGLSCIQPILLFPVSLMNVYFKNLTVLNKIPSKIFIYNTLWLSIASAAMAIFGKSVFIYFFGEKYLYIATYIPLFAVIAFLNGFFTPYNQFLAAKGLGKEVRNTGFILSAANIILNFLLIPVYGMPGAIYATILALVIDNIAHMYYYFKTTGQRLS